MLPNTKGRGSCLLCFYQFCPHPWPTAHLFQETFNTKQRHFYCLWNSLTKSGFYGHVSPAKGLASVHIFRVTCAGRCSFSWPCGVTVERWTPAALWTLVFSRAALSSPGALHRLQWASVPGIVMIIFLVPGHTLVLEQHTAREVGSQAVRTSPFFPSHWTQEPGPPAGKSSGAGEFFFWIAVVSSCQRALTRACWVHPNTTPLFQVLWNRGWGLGLYSKEFTWQPATPVLGEAC